MHNVSSLPTFCDVELSESRARFDRLVMSFPTLRGCPGTMPWNAGRFAAWASGCDTRAQRNAAQFVLSVWNGSTPDDAWWCEDPLEVGRFDPVDALAYWDQMHRAAFLRWCEDPFWP